ncbi:hydroxymethylglutaryl-CoA lyase [uncultured Croceicoccus sp.]|uniref:hydroxymethylglutaryl-CoA lyase n=1 Tax=uncultured Croceicoccus sp. TaxID=1295329 RepID=UPI00260FA7FD|nr:hydroxymethylglutaryl-CoA lyase [uncultured Croceicoccus sp.]
MILPETIELVEVGARDGLQNEKTLVSTADKIELIRRAAAAGARRMEVASFVNPRRVPQMEDAENVCAGIEDLDVVRIGLVLNRRGAERALATCVDELGTVACASDGFGIANQGQTSAESVEEAAAIIRCGLDAGRRAQATISVAFGCPYGGPVDPGRVGEMARRLGDAGAHEIALADTIGVAGPGDVVRVMKKVRVSVPDIPIRLHFHDTRNMAIANALIGVSLGASVLDGSIGGLGGCPFAPGASGNVATESLVYMLDSLKIESGLDHSELCKSAQWILTKLGRQ